ncbi:PVC-type heme-binding CxxCH protein [Tuwongella immobilis]|uniref:Cytochrome c domain-containing protein n=1 Tax=Tuwongella immobilis TaxID=692036 RepID=A0A6C2YRN2_9BACT|nr:PVC-type heme-binding CxxCH protein [Tuwongella immobilis]VIP03829.1 membrane-bound dehydrogenase : Putative membrane-bound dehydrogenase OS=Singulisphaera acidiphila (strain ATCC BAA-1392 / DSM 18658 / VKM B-2454 / MOB10) GN=Sinac_0923 PE=4 SV=1: HEAT_2: Cytochrom_C [Tuwongella immobilis]VTS05025.1 membrane-bound dehydrogenase : Putative membrane-bound dehydrogenase OS=Singulisphaera acidiphila (strain ATCC BAA-1392 / DSM 18658 / VKM B-2454 / MOB10) GN=Sinac_0923 PE=4 SV=1: HEAT_2: Cytochrom_
MRQSVMGFRLLVGGFFTAAILLGFGQRAVDSAEPKPVAAAETDSKPPLLRNSDPLSPAEEQKTFRLAPGLTIELVAAEPDVVDPVAMTFDEQGQIYVAEMRGYPNGGVATGNETGGRIRRLTDRDGDGKFETAVTFLEGLRFPTSVMVYRKGLLIANAPEILYAEDTTGDGKADVVKVLYTGFALNNIQQLINSFQWGMDNWVHINAGFAGGTIRSPEKPDMPPVTLSGRGARFKPDQPGSLEPTSGGGQYGLTCDPYSRWFTATNSQHLRQIILPDEYLRKNPYLSVPTTTWDIPEHGASCKVFRISPFEKWRVERTTRRAGGPDAKRFVSTELVPGGYVTSGCSPLVYNADQFPETYRGTVLICDPANNLITRDTLRPNGAAYIASRADANAEFLASTDNWFRPTWLTLAPDGSVFVLDFYREVIETPLSLPEDIKQRLILHSRERGRIWRIRSQSAPSTLTVNLANQSLEQWVANLDSPNYWWRIQSQRLLVQQADRKVIPALEAAAKSAKSGPGRVHALWTLQGLQALTAATLIPAFGDVEAGVREHALRLGESLLTGESAAEIRKAMLTAAKDADARVRFQAALSLGQIQSPEVANALATILRKDGDDRWTTTAILASAGNVAPELLQSLIADAEFVRSPNAAGVITRLSAMNGATQNEANLAKVLSSLTSVKTTGWEMPVLEGLGQGLQNTKRPLNTLWTNPPATLTKAVSQALPFFERAAERAGNAKLSVSDRIQSIRLLAFGPYPIAGKRLAEMLSPQQPSEIQLASLRALAVQESPEVASAILSAWPAMGPTLRREAGEVLFAKLDRMQALLTAIERKQILPAQLEAARIAQLRSHANGQIRARSEKLLAGLGQTDRAKVVDAYRDALTMASDPLRGKAVFAKNCSVCHRLENVGVQVGPDLVAAIRGKPKDYLLVAILDPSREVDPRYVNYQAVTENGRLLSGMLAAETTTSITLRRAEGQEDTILRSQLDEITATPKSLMPEELEKQFTKQELADLLAYLQSATGG